MLASEDVVDRFTEDPVWIRGTGNGTVSYDITKRDDYLEAEPTVEAAKRGYDAAGIGPDDIDIVEQHDCFPSTELLNIGGIGFCKKDNGGEFVASGAAHLDRDLPVNLSGGPKGKDHPTGATGVAQLCELTWQLRGETGERQVKDPTYGLQHNLAGSLAIINVALVLTDPA